jgi:bifunctional non-homologous end joining protein LigD
MYARLVSELPERKDWLYQIEFIEWTQDGHLRHAKFVGLREDKDPKDVVREIVVDT